MPLREMEEKHAENATFLSHCNGCGSGHSRRTCRLGRALRATLIAGGPADANTAGTAAAASTAAVRSCTNTASTTKSDTTTISHGEASRLSAFSLLLRCENAGLRARRLFLWRS